VEAWTGPNALVPPEGRVEIDGLLEVVNSDDGKLLDVIQTTDVARL
jgi:hypothetical protein